MLDWARRLFSPSTTRPSTTSPAVIRRRAQDAALDVLARPSPKTKRRLDVSPSKTKRAPFASLRHGRQRRYLQTEVSQTKTVSFTVRLWGVGQSGDTAASELATAAADGSLTTSPATASTNAGYDDGPACSGDANSLEALQAVTIAEGAPSCNAGHRADAGAVGEADLDTKTDARRVRAMFGTGVLVRRDARGVHR